MMSFFVDTSMPACQYDAMDPRIYVHLIQRHRKLKAESRCRAYKPSGIFSNSSENLTNRKRTLIIFSKY